MPEETPFSGMCTEEDGGLKIPLADAHKITELDERILRLLVDDGQLSVTEVAEELGVDKSAVSKASQRLDGLGLLNRVKDSGKFGRTILVPSSLVGG